MWILTLPGCTGVDDLVIIPAFDNFSIDAGVKRVLTEANVTQAFIELNGSFLRFAHIKVDDGKTHCSRLVLGGLDHHAGQSMPPRPRRDEIRRQVYGKTLRFVGEIGNQKGLFERNL